MKHDALRSDLDRILRQRNTLLKQAGGRLTDEVGVHPRRVGRQARFDAATPSVARGPQLVDDLRPLVAEAYSDLAGPGDARPTCATNRHGARPGWPRRSPPAAPTTCADSCRLVGPHRDELELSIAAMPARTHASQGEQRTLALALRLAGHRLVAERVGSPPVLVLDDVLSELDPTRATALLRHLPAGQVVITTAGALPEAAHPDRVLHVAGGTVQV